MKDQFTEKILKICMDLMEKKPVNVLFNIRQEEPGMLSASIITVTRDNPNARSRRTKMMISRDLIASLKYPKMALSTITDTLDSMLNDMWEEEK